MHCRIAHYATGTRKIRAEAGLEMCIALLATVEQGSVVRKADYSIKWISSGLPTIQTKFQRNLP
jgi:hypothetical protein